MDVKRVGIDVQHKAMAVAINSSFTSPQLFRSHRQVTEALISVLEALHTKLSFIIAQSSYSTMKATVLQLILMVYSAAIMTASATGVFAAICIDDYGGITDRRATKNCCAAIGGGKHFYNEISCQCESLGGIAFRRVWEEAFEQCCISNNLGSNVCNSDSCWMATC